MRYAVLKAWPRRCHKKSTHFLGRKVFRLDTTLPTAFWAPPCGTKAEPAETKAARARREKTRFIIMVLVGILVKLYRREQDQCPNNSSLSCTRILKKRGERSRIGGPTVPYRETTVLCVRETVDDRATDVLLTDVA
jgi:hypothetical protein